MILPLLFAACIPAHQPTTPGFCDQDGDGFQRSDVPCVVEGQLIPQGDCDDTRADVGPQAAEQCGGAVDHDCDGLVGCEDGDCATDPACVEYDCHDGLDGDEDGWFDCRDDDCWLEPECTGTIAVRVDSGTACVSSFHWSSVRTSMRTYGTYPDSWVVFGTTSTHSCGGMVDARLNGVVEVTTTDGVGSSCSFTSAELAWSGSDHVVNAPCELVLGRTRADSDCGLDLAAPTEIRRLWRRYEAGTARFLDVTGETVEPWGPPFEGTAVFGRGEAYITSF